jgi:hypothetical protein
MSRHTPGPWFHVARGAIRSESKDIACVWFGEFDGNKAEDLANARLIAAAPQQNDALLAVLYAPGFDALDEATKNAVRAAIAKAKGEA